MKKTYFRSKVKIYGFCLSFFMYSLFLFFFNPSYKAHKALAEPVSFGTSWGDSTLLVHYPGDSTLLVHYPGDSTLLVHYPDPLFITHTCGKCFHELMKISIKQPGVERGAGIAQWLEHRTRDWKVAGSNPCWNGGRIFFSRVDFLCWLLFRYPFHPRVTTVARKKSRSFCQKVQVSGYS